MNVYAVLARLIDYPSDTLVEHLDEAHAHLANDSTLGRDEKQALLATVEWMRELAPLDLQAEYVQTFDTVPENALYMTHHTFGDSRERGPALVELGMYYRKVGFAPQEGELPDYLPLMLEFVARLDAASAGDFLAEAAPILTQLASNLELAENRYAPLLRFVADRGQCVRTAA